jgi:hypothetical protein
MGSERTSASSVLVPALVRVRLRQPSDPAAIEAVLTRAIATIDPPVVPEIVWMPLLSRSSPPRPQLTFALLLEFAAIDRAMREERVEKVARRAAKAVKAIEKAVTKAARREFSSPPEVVVRLAEKPGEQAACLRAMIGNPRDRGLWDSEP